jgi:hypothetical protein
MTWAPTSVLAHTVVAAGFLYDPVQDIIYSRLDALQRKAGYHWGFDEAAAPFGMIIDCEPFYFQYAGKLWMIELWKGQYDVECGAEIGVYRDNVGLPLPPGARWYACVDTADQLTMKFTLYLNGRELLHRGPESHWWLTGFKWGVFTALTSDLTMDLEIVFPKTEMRDAFKQVVREKGYATTEKNSFSIAFTFDSPRTEQPLSRWLGEGIEQAKNERLVAGYNDLKRMLRIPNNDPNAFTGEAAMNIPLVRHARTAIRVGTAVGRTAAKTLQRRATHAVRRVQSEAEAEAEGAKQTYRELVRSVEKWLE